MNVNRTQKPSNGKHARRACLACRKRHLKCEGQEPVCMRCQEKNRECSYVKSNRGGSRQKGVSTKGKVLNGYDKIKVERGNYKSDMLPCVKNGLGHLSNHSDCKEDCLKIDNFNKAPPCMKPNHQFSDGTKRGDIFLHPIFNESKDNDPINFVFSDSYLQPSLDQCYISPSLIKDINIPVIISRFYSTFYKAHPFLPPQNEIENYLNLIPYKYDLLIAMRIIADGETCNKYAKDIETVNFLVNSLVKYIRQVGKDFISLQSLLLIAMVAHISSLHDLSSKIREAAISLALEMRLNYIDEKNVPDLFLDVNGFITEKESNEASSGLTPSDTDGKGVTDYLFESERVNAIPREILVETMRKTFWELYFFDSISGTASGHTKSRLAVQPCLVLYPTSVSLHKFDFKSRAEACKLVNDAISLNIAIQSNSDTLPHSNHMRAALGNWEMKLSDPEAFGVPYLINKKGIVNEGVFEAIMLLNYARIFTHRPFSYLWRSDVSKHPRCTDEEGVDDPCPPLANKGSSDANDSRKIIETWKTIDSANFLVKTLLDTDPSRTCERTPFVSCALAFSCLVHLSAYAWAETNPPGPTGEDNESRETAESEIDVYTEYIKLEIGSILQISRHWSLSAKLVTHISETLARVSPKLFRKVQAGVLPLGLNIATLVYNNQNNIKSSSSRPMGDVDSANSLNSLEPLTGTDTLETRSTNDGSNTPRGNIVLNKILLPEKELNEQLDTSSTLDSAVNNSKANSVYGAVSSPYPLNVRPNTEGNNNNNNFMSDFNELVNGMNTNNMDLATSSVLGFPVEGQDYDFFDPLSPRSDTGCDWVDKHAFQFDAFLTPNEVL